MIRAQAGGVYLGTLSFGFFVRTVRCTAFLLPEFHAAVRPGLTIASEAHNQRTELEPRRPSKLEIEETKTLRLRVSSCLFDCEPNVFHLLVDNLACDKQLNIAQNKMN
jgi:hypothetical protein